ncbi:MAG: chromosome partitioning protein ParA, partial [Bacteroidaceae bacterium]|nr:chromosome partitioning protein ParA [Bacteroidaceae bacterium]
MNNQTKKNENELNVLDLFMYLLSKWKWFLLSVLIFGGLAWLKYASSPFVYFRQATVIIKDPSNKTSSAGLDRYDNLINKVNVANELLQFRSKKLMSDVIKRLNADVSYQKTDRFRKIELYTQAPVKVSFPDALPGTYMALNVTPVDKEHVRIQEIVNGEPAGSQTVGMNQPVSLKQGKVVVAPTNFYNDSWKDVDILVQKMPLDGMVGYFLGCIGIRQESEESSILTLSIKDSSPARAEDVLNTLIEVYNETAIKDKNQVAVNTANFINERLIII